MPPQAVFGDMQDKQHTLADKGKSLEALQEGRKAEIGRSKGEAEGQGPSVR